MTDSKIRANLTKLKKEIDATIVEIDSELQDNRPTLKLLVPRDDEKKRCTLNGNKDVLIFIQTLLEKIFYAKPEPDEDDTNLKYFKDQLDKSITLIGDNVKNVKSLHPAIGLPDVTEMQFTQMIGRQEMFVHFKEMLTEFGM